MKEPAAVSPFAALSRQEQKEQWICWQCQRGPEPVEAKPTIDDDRVGFSARVQVTDSGASQTDRSSAETDRSREAAALSWTV